MPPASLPAMPAMSPGPMTARNATQAAPAAEAPAQAQHVTAPRRRSRSRAERPDDRGGPASRPWVRERRRSTRDGALLAGRIVSMASSTVTIPTSCRRRRRPARPAGCSARRPAHIVLVGQDLDGDRLLDHDLADRRRRRSDDEIAQRQDPDQAPVARRRRRRSRWSPRRAPARAAGRWSRRPSGRPGPRRTRSSSSRRPMSSG